MCSIKQIKSGAKTIIKGDEFLRAVSSKAVMQKNIIEKIKNQMFVNAKFEFF
jgi:hypothetical protein